MSRSPRPDPAAAERFQRLFEANYRDLLAYALRRTSGPTDAHDVVADVFLTAWRRLPDVPGETDEDRMWLYGAARRVLANHERAHRRSGLLVERSIAFATTATTGWTDGATDPAPTTAARRALATLSPADRELILLSVWEELSVGEIASALDLSRATTSVRLHRAKARLRRAFASMPDHAEGRTVADDCRALPAYAHDPARRRSDG